MGSCNMSKHHCPLSVLLSVSMEGFVPKSLLYCHVVTDDHGNAEYSDAAE